MNSTIKTYSYPNGEIQRVQCVSLDSFDELNFFEPAYSDSAFSRIVNLYRDYIVPKQPLAFGNMLLFKLTDNISIPSYLNIEKYGHVSDRLTIASIIFNDGLKIVKGKPQFRTSGARRLYSQLIEAGCAEIVCGKLPHTKILPVNNSIGYMSDSHSDASMKVNSSFFIMDCFDCASVYDSIGNKIGLNVKDGYVSNPPLYNREALLAFDNGDVTISSIGIDNLTVKIGDKVFDRKNSKIYTRPKRALTPRCNGMDIVIVGTSIRAIHIGGRTQIPSSGFVLSIANGSNIRLSDTVYFTGFDNVKFGLQVGNSAVVNGEPTYRFISRFYNIRTLGKAYPPSLYPLNYKNDRAPRIALGVGIDNNPVIIWAEGSGKLRYESGLDSCGASLFEMANICSDLKLVNAINLDGGGSAQILLHNERQLLVSDRNFNNEEQERAVPVGLIVY